MLPQLQREAGQAVLRVACGRASVTCGFPGLTWLVGDLGEIEISTPQYLSTCAVSILRTSGADREHGIELLGHGTERGLP